MPLKRGEHRFQVEAHSGPTRRCIVFAVDGTEYGIAVRDVKQSMPAPSHAEAAVNVHGQSYPIVDARALFGLSPSAATDRMLLAVAGTQDRAGLIVDRVVRVATIQEAAIVPLPRVFEGTERRWVEGLARIDSRVVALVRTDGLVGFHHRPASPACLAAPSGDR